MPDSKKADLQKQKRIANVAKQERIAKVINEKKIPDLRRKVIDKLIKNKKFSKEEAEKATDLAITYLKNRIHIRQNLINYIIDDTDIDSIHQSDLDKCRDAVVLAARSIKYFLDRETQLSEGERRDESNASVQIQFEFGDPAKNCDDTDLGLTPSGIMPNCQPPTKRRRL